MSGGKQLGVRYVLEGSVQREQNKVRVNAQLICGPNGSRRTSDWIEKLNWNHPP